MTPQDNSTDARSQRRASNREPVSFKRKNGTSQFKGVLFVKRQQKWRAQICYQGKKKYFGSHETEIEAALARDAGIREMFGERVQLLNFPNLKGASQLMGHKGHGQREPQLQTFQFVPYNGDNYRGQQRRAVQRGIPESQSRCLLSFEKVLEGFDFSALSWSKKYER